jgi:type VI secretion system (T6SS) phospholipase Tle1-like effector
MPRSKIHHHHTTGTTHAGSGRELGKLERQYSDYVESVTNVEEVWFAGCHCGSLHLLLMLFFILTSIYADIGGGSVVNATRNSLARIPLRWMIRQCFIANTGIMFHKATFPKVGLDPNTLYPQVLPRPPIIFQDPNIHTIPVPKPLVINDDRKAVVYSDGGSFVNEAEEDLADALSPMYDQLELAKFWWILEMIPQKIKYQSGRNDLMVTEIKYVTVSFFFFVFRNC